MHAPSERLDAWAERVITAQNLEEALELTAGAGVVERAGSSALLVISTRRAGGGVHLSKPRRRVR